MREALQFPESYYEKKETTESSATENEAAMFRFPTERLTPERQAELYKQRSWFRNLFTHIRPYHAAAWLLAGSYGLINYGKMPEGGEFKEKMTPGVTCEIGNEHPYTMRVVTSNFESEQTTKEIEIEDTGVKAMVKDRGNESSMGGIRDLRWWNKFLEEKTHDPTILKKAGVTFEEAFDPSVVKALNIAREIVAERPYDDEFLRKVEAAASGKVGVEKIAAMRDANKKYTEESNYDNRPIDDIFRNKEKIVCRHSAIIFREIMDWLRERHGKYLSNVYVATERGVDPQGNIREQLVGHAWARVTEVLPNRVIHVRSVEVTSTSEGNESTLPESRRKVEPYEMLQMMTNMRRDKIDSYALMSLYDGIEDGFMLAIKKDNEDAGSALSSLLGAVDIFIKGSATEEEKTYFKNREKMLLATYVPRYASVMSQDDCEMLERVLYNRNFGVYKKIVLNEKEPDRVAKDLEETGFSALGDARVNGPVLTPEEELNFERVFGVYSGLKRSVDRMLAERGGEKEVDAG